MKNINKIFTIVILTLLVTSCGDDFLTKKPQAALVQEDFYRNEYEAFQGLVGTYDPLGWESTFDMSWWSIGDGAAGDLAGTSLGVTGVMQYSYSPSNGGLLDFWPGMYGGIDRANGVINRASEADFDENLKARFIAEAKFLRALYYFTLVTYWGGVPIITEPVPPAELKDLSRSSVAEVYALIEQDLNDAIAVLPDQSDIPLQEMGRASKGAAQSLLAKAYLYQEKWSDAANMANIVITSGEYELEEDYHMIFQLENENGKECIFSIQMSTSGDQGWGNSNEGSQFPRWHEPLCMGGWGNMYPEDTLINAFEPDDKRYRSVVVDEGDRVIVPGNRFVPPDYVLQEGESYHPDDSRNTIPCLGCGKWWTIERYRDDMSPLNWILIRLGDVILMRAEALAESEDLTAAATELNKIRNRAGLPSIAPATKQDMIDAIRQERHVELALEGHRFYDLRRWGILIEYMTALGETNVSSKDMLFPIPQIEMDLHEGAMEQNPGWN